MMTTQSLLSLPLFPPGFSLSFTFCLPSFLPLIYISLPVYLFLSFPHSIFSSNKEIKEGLLLTCQCDVPAGYSTFFLSHAVLSQYDTRTHVHTQTGQHCKSWRKDGVKKMDWSSGIWIISAYKELWHAETTGLLSWLLPWNYTIFCEKTMIANHN